MDKFRYTPAESVTPAQKIATDLAALCLAITPHGSGILINPSNDFTGNRWLNWIQIGDGPAFAEPDRGGSQSGEIRLSTIGR